MPPYGGCASVVPGIDVAGALHMSSRTASAIAILDEFAAATGLTSSRPPRRYLWTDAFAASTWVGLREETGDAGFLDLALRLVERVHHVLGRYAPDEARRGWLSGLDDAQGEAHPTARGLRIGKPLPERAPREPYDSELEWDRDGQYFHYLTKWMQALAGVARASSDERYSQWARELAQAAHRAFVHPRGMYWKMSVDLTRPLVASMGLHDPLDGAATFASLGLADETATMLRMCTGRSFASDDSLGAGGLLVDALHLVRLVAQGHAELHPLATQVLQDAEVSADAVARSGFMRLPAERRLAFRELGFALGLHAVAPLADYAGLERLQAHVPLATALEDFWLEPAHQAAASWTEHADINAVTLAATLAPRGALAAG